IMVVGVMINATVGVLVVISLLKRDVSQPDPFSAGVTSSLQSMPDVLWLLLNLWPYFLLALLLVVVISAIFGLVESFRIAGPIYRMKRILQSIGDGDFSDTPLMLRKRDQLVPLYKSVVMVHARWREHVQLLHSLCDEEGTADERLLKIKGELSSYLTEQAQ
ncbi:MAG: hypothetical protein Q9M13_02435, partial [Mariprofundales bacterium]|nr:hypothetical protein [Mariprofundales bacterium]